MITKAIIPVAGWGTRMLPITKSIEKCMLPIGNRPLVDYVVQDCLKAGITEIIFVVGEQSVQLEQYYRSNIQLNDYLWRNGKIDQLKMVAPIKAKMHFVVQSSHGKYGTAVPVSLASGYIDDGESAVVLMGDDFVYNKDGTSEVSRLIQSTDEGMCSMLAAKVEDSDVSKYGVIKMNDKREYQSIIEKPSKQDTPSNLINISKYILTKEVIDMCGTVPVSERGEYELPTAINNFVDRGGRMKVVPIHGTYLDGGSPKGWLHANNVVAETSLE